MKRHLALGAIASLVLSSTAFAGDSVYKFEAKLQNQDDQALFLGGQVSGYFFSQARAKAAFGNSILYYGITVTQNNIPYDWKIRPDFGIFAANNNGNRLFIVPVQAVISKKFAKPGDEVQPYVRAGAGLAYFDYRIDETFPGPITVRTKGSKIGTSAMAEFGVIAAQRFRVFASYNLYNKQSGFDFSGFQIGATISFFKL